jgi:hypothetical protein
VRPATVCAFLAGLALASAAVPEPASAGGAQGPAAGAEPAREIQVAAAPAPLRVSALGPALPRPDDVAAALPPAPEKVVLDPGYFGAVTLDHRAHLARRATCKACHGPGPVTKLGRLPPARAHQACRGCHQELAKGPTECRGCHLVKPPVPETAIAAAGDGSSATGPAGEAAPGGSEGAAHPAEASGPPARRFASEAPDAEPEYLALRRTLHAGMSVVSAEGGAPAAGFTAGVTLQQDGFVMSNSFEWSGSGRRSRTLGLLGGGVVLPVREHLNGHLLGVGGFDFSQGSLANVVPAAGARTSLEWTGGAPWLRSLQLSLTAMVDLARHRDRPESEARGFVLSAGIAAGVEPGRAGGGARDAPR